MNDEQTITIRTASYEQSFWDDIVKASTGRGARPDFAVAQADAALVARRKRNGLDPVTGERPERKEP